MVLDGPVSETVKVSSLKPTVNISGRILFISLFLWLWAEAICSRLGNRKQVPWHGNSLEKTRVPGA